MKKNTLIYGIGNPGRGDDGLGFAFIERLPIDILYDTHCAYQLNIEDAELFAKYTNIMIIDAAKNLDTNFTFNTVEPKDESSFSTHSMSVATVAALCHNLFRKQPKVRLLAIKGIDFQLKIGLSHSANNALEDALFWFNLEKINILTLH
ncbi:MAG: hydrogenase maturation protease [Bdellovibrionota bacterium]